MGEYEDWEHNAEPYGFLNPSPLALSYEKAILAAEAFGASYPKLKEYAKMKQNEDILAEAQKLREQAEELERRVAEREKYGADPFKNGDVIKVSMKYRGSRVTYSYAVIKTAGKFYISGRMGMKAGEVREFTWDELVAWLAQADASVWRAGSLERVL